MINSIIEKIKGLDKLKKRGIAIALSVVLAANGFFIFGKKDKHNKVYLVDLKDKYQNEVILKDKNNDKIDIDSEKDNILAITFNKKNKPGELVEVILIDKNGKMKSGFIDGKFLDRKIIDKIEIDEEVINKLSNIGVVVAKEGTYLENQTANAYTNGRLIHLNEGENLLLGDISTINKDSSLTFSDAVVVTNSKNKRELKKGIVPTDYIRSNDYSKIDGNHLTVTNLKKESLKIREGATTKSKILGTLENNDEVIRIENMPVIENESYDWFYIATKNKKTGEIICGFVVATYYKENEIINYLSASNDINKDIPIVDRIYKIVDTTGINGQKLNMRIIPDEKGKIISYIENGTILYVSKNKTKAEVDYDGNKWVYVYTNSGQKGYVNSDFIKDINFKPSAIKNSRTQKFGRTNAYKLNGYYGIDVDSTLSKINFEKLINGDLEISAKSSEKSREINDAKPKFVMIKLGDASKVDGSIIENNEVYSYRVNNLVDIVNLCEEKKVPYGFYYQFNLTNEKSVMKELNYIFESLKTLSGGIYNILPISIGIESLSEKNIESNTKMINKIMNIIRENTNNEVMVKLNNENIVGINYELFDAQNGNSIWIDEYSDSLTSFYQKNVRDYGKFISNSVIRKIAINQTNEEASYNIDFINKAYYDFLIEKLKLNLNQAKVK